MKKTFWHFIFLLTLFQGTVVRAQAVYMALDNGQIVTDKSETRLLSMRFFLHAGLGTHTLQSDHKSKAHAEITISLGGIDGGVEPTGEGAELFDWVYDPTSKTYTGSAMDGQLLADKFYPIELAGLVISKNSASEQTGFTANLTPPSDLLATNNESNGHMSLYLNTPLSTASTSETSNQRAPVTAVNGEVINDISSELAPILYPNPVKDRLKIEGNKTWQVQLLNLNGEIKYDAVNIPVEGIDMSGFSSGLYLIKIISSNGSVTVQKVLKQ
jgi:hypothetical protein